MQFGYTSRLSFLRFPLFFFGTHFPNKWLLFMNSSLLLGKLGPKKQRENACRLFMNNATFDQVFREQYICALFVDLQISLFSNFFIKNRFHGTIHIFKNYFATMFLVFSFSKISYIQTDPKYLSMDECIYILVRVKTRVVSQQSSLMH